MASLECNYAACQAELTQFDNQTSSTLTNERDFAKPLTFWVTTQPFGLNRTKKIKDNFIFIMLTFSKYLATLKCSERTHLSAVECAENLWVWSVRAELKQRWRLRTLLPLAGWKGELQPIAFWLTRKKTKPWLWVQDHLITLKKMRTAFLNHLTVPWEQQRADQLEHCSSESQFHVELQQRRRLQTAKHTNQNNIFTLDLVVKVV